MVSVDKPQLDSVGDAGALDCGEELPPFTVCREVSEVADLDDDRAVFLIIWLPAQAWCGRPGEFADLPDSGCVIDLAGLR